VGRQIGGELGSRPLHFIWIADCSGSMSGQKIQTLNFAIRESIPAMRNEAEENPNAQLLVRAVKFSHGAQWHIATPTPVDQFQWTDLGTSGETDMGKALSLVAEQLKMPPMPERALPPVLILLSDGQPTDDFSKGLRELMDQPWGKKAVRLAIAIGSDADTDVLQKFIGNQELPVLQANNPQVLVDYIKWVSTQVVKSVSAPPSTGVGAGPQDNLVAGAAAVAQNAGDVDDVW
jgi:uncharacterized protein YegL